MFELAEVLRDRLPKDSIEALVLESLGHAWGDGYLRDAQYHDALVWLDERTRPSAPSDAP